MGGRARETISNAFVRNHGMNLDEAEQMLAG